MLACSRDWFALPPRLRALVWAEYTPGQEITKRATLAYVEVVHKCIDYWEAENAPPETP